MNDASEMLKKSLDSLSRFEFDNSVREMIAEANARAESAESDALKMRLLLGRVYLALSRAAAEPTDTAELVEVMTLIEQIAGKPGSKQPFTHHFYSKGHPMTTESTPSFDTFALVEIMGHLKLAGRVSEQTIAGQGFIRIDVPDVEGQPGYTRIFGPGSIYSITPCSHELAIAFCQRNHTRPVQAYELSLPEPRRAVYPEGFEADDDPAPF